jgi:hypothetical protein
VLSSLLSAVLTVDDAIPQPLSNWAMTWMVRAVHWTAKPTQPQQSGLSLARHWRRKELYRRTLFPSASVTFRGSLYDNEHRPSNGNL